ncbi:hypothetical protein [Desulfovibrio inopinatus]|uniref:hypothetical protein n=1 Tax=Desulfovibrio inopinatus TaxID=102109 RepID=UPI00048988AD|nr:hypothetical protein [Desulfovibrio inopinatus]
MKHVRLVVIGIAGMVGLACLVAIGVQVNSLNIAWFMSALESTPAWIFLVCALFLPLVGMPISIVFVAAAMRFGTYMGCLLLIIVVPLHLAMALILTHKALRRLFFIIWRRDIVFLPSLVAKRPGFWAFFLSAAPGIPYMIKNYLMALSPLPVRYFFLVAWPVHVVQALPYLFFGEAVRSSNWWSFGAGLGVFVLILICMEVVRRRRESIQ